MNVKCNFVTCQEITTNENGTFNLMCVFNKIRTLGYPHETSMDVFTEVFVEPGDYNLQYELAYTDGEVLVKSIPIPFSVVDPSYCCFAHFSTINVTFRKPGRYEYRVFVDDKLIDTRPFWVLRE